jgi:hypothetical protein
MLIWGLDKIINPQHGIEVALKFYGGAQMSTAPMKAFGAAQLALGFLVVVGVLRRFTYPALLLVAATTLVGVWRSIIDPLGLFLEGGYILFYPSLIVFAAALVLWAFRDDDAYSWDRRFEPR